MYIALLLLINMNEQLLTFDPIGSFIWPPKFKAIAL